MNNLQQTEKDQNDEVIKSLAIVFPAAQTNAPTEVENIVEMAMFSQKINRWLMRQTQAQNLCKPVIYIAGKVTGLDYENHVLPKFRATQLELEAAGFTVINPIEWCNKTDAWPLAMRKCIMLLALVQYVHFQPDWTASEGAKLENILAEKIELKRVCFN